MSDTADPTTGMISKAYTAEEVNFTPGERSAVFWITTDHVDHEGDVVVASGVDFKHYVEENPVVMVVHDYGRWPVGQCQWIKFKRADGFNGLIAKNDFDEDPDAELAFYKVKKRTVRSVSVGFLPHPDMKPGDWGPPTREEIAKRPDWANARRIIRRCLLIEYSICPIGMNPHALQIAVSKGLHRPRHDSPEARTMPDSTTKGAVPFKSCSNISDAPWNGDEDIAAIRKHCSKGNTGAKEDMNWSEYEKFFTWVDSSDRENFGSYKMPHHKIEGGKFVLLRHKVAMNVAELHGGRAGGVAVPEGELSGIESHLRKHYEEDLHQPFPEGKPSTQNVTGGKSVNKDMADGDGPAGGYTVGDHVRHKASGMCGEIKSVHTSGKHTLGPEGDESGREHEASEGEPVYRMAMHDEHCKCHGPMSRYLGKSLEHADAESEEAEEDMDDDGDGDDEAKGFRRGDHVKIKAPHYRGVGVIHGVYRKGHVPDVDEDIRATDDEPAARVRAYRKMGDGHEPTDDFIAAHVKHLSHLPEDLHPPTKPKQTTAPKRKEAALPPLVALPEPDPAVAVQSALSKLNNLLRPETIRAEVVAELDRRGGVI